MEIEIVYHNELINIENQLSRYFIDISYLITPELNLLFNSSMDWDIPYSNFKQKLIILLTSKNYNLTTLKMRIEKEMIQREHLSLGGYFLKALAQLTELDNEQHQLSNDEFFQRICSLHHTLGIIEGAYKAFPLREAFYTIKNNAKKGGAAKAKKYNELKTAALKIMENKQPSTGYKNIADCVNIIQNELVDISRLNGTNLSQYNLYQLISKWMRDDFDFKNQSKVFFHKQKQ